ncbi:uncharacterized protein LTR77_010609 [Saxophila tyrrhenica]|uniref:Uncharacterized protein n=1 Tax=Saxophila tyrrhenica TaxID=1690608 RepID=A0AAV9NUM3_9PEZI|nr:hypothetical protein LTR77_010609 [Saxophila tyrrhenica]
MATAYIEVECRRLGRLHDSVQPLPSCHTLLPVGEKREASQDYAQLPDHYIFFDLLKKEAAMEVSAGIAPLDVATFFLKCIPPMKIRATIIDPTGPFMMIRTRDAMMDVAKFVINPLEQARCFREDPNLQTLIRAQWPGIDGLAFRTSQEGFLERYNIEITRQNLTRAEGDKLLHIRDHRYVMVAVGTAHIRNVNKAKRVELLRDFVVAGDVGLRELAPGMFL